MMAKKPKFDPRMYREARDLHTRVAYMLKDENWCYVHEYHYRGGSMDFAAIHRVTGKIQLIECKTVITDSNAAAQQLVRYCKDFGFPGVFRRIYTLGPITEYQSRVLQRYSVMAFQISLDTPQIPYGDRATCYEEFKELYVHFHGHSPLHACYVGAKDVKRSYGVTYPLPPVIS
jgi:hypothetical protein